MSQLLTPQVEQGVRLGASFLPALMLLVPVLMMWRYPIDGARHEQIRAALAARRPRHAA